MAGVFNPRHARIREERAYRLLVLGSLVGGFAAGDEQRWPFVRRARWHYREAGEGGHRCFERREIQVPTRTAVAKNEALQQEIGFTRVGDRAGKFGIGLAAARDCAE